MNLKKHRRQILLFLIAILLPAAVLIGLAVRVVRQETELAETRAADERRRALEQARWQLTARLEAIKLQEMGRRIRTASATTGQAAADPAVVLVTTLEGDRIVPPWEAPGAKLKTASPEFQKARQSGESLEFGRKDLAKASETYRQAVRVARSPAEACEARLLLARVLVKRSAEEEAARTLQAMLKECGSAVDEDGIRYTLYAAERLIAAGLDAKAGEDYLSNEVRATRWRRPLESYLIRSALLAVPGEPPQKTLQSLSTQIDGMEQMAALAKDFPKVRAGIESVIGADPVWFAYGIEPWLISLTPATPTLPPLVFIVSSQPVAPPATKLVAGQTADGAWLGQGFLNLSVEWAPGRFETRGRVVPTSLYAAGLALILGMTLLGGYLLLRDVNRDVRTAEMRSHFVANVSHELKTPLTAIRMFADTLVLGRSNSEDTRTEYLETIANESERLTRLVDNVLEFSKVEQGKKIYRMRPANLAEVVKCASRAIRYPLAQQGFRLNIYIDEKTPAVAADADAMEQAVLNLLSNAMKYSGDAREIDLRLTFSQQEAAIEVTDRGLGIPPGDQKRIFEKFYRVRSAETECIAGTGLGLTLVQHIAQAHGGRVDVQSAAGEGTTFSIRIPLPATEEQT